MLSLGTFIVQSVEPPREDKTGGSVNFEGSFQLAEDPEQPFVA